MGMSRGIDLFFVLGSVAYYFSRCLSLMASIVSRKNGKCSILHVSPKRLARYLRAKRMCKKEGRDIMPKDLFDLKGFMVAGPDNNCYTKELDELWGIRPMELFAGRELSCIGTEHWTRDRLYFFPDRCL